MVPLTVPWNSDLHTPGARKPIHVVTDMFPVSANLTQRALARLLLVVALLLCCPADPVVSAEESLERKVAAWVVELDDDLYATRHSAQQRLEQTGLPALMAVAEEARTGSLESSTRALNIMLAWSESPDHQLQIATLEQLVTLPNRPIEAGLATELLADAREQAALKAITDLGGKYALDQQVRSVFNQRTLQVTIDSHWKGDYEGLKHLTAVRSATTISFHSAPIDDRVVEYLVDLPTVLRLEFYGTPRLISAEAEERLLKQLPQVREDLLVIRSGAQLGIQGSGTDPGPVKIAKVVGGAARNAGLQNGDAISELNGEKIKDFEHLTTLISEYRPGDSVELTILRDRKLLQKRVVFDRWGESDLNEKAVKANDTQPLRFAPRRITLERR